MMRLTGSELSTSELTAPASAESRYRVRAYKISICPWVSGYSNTASDSTFPATSSNLTAIAMNSWLIKLDRDDNTSDEDGYGVEVLTASGEYVQIANLTANKPTCHLL